MSARRAPIALIVLALLTPQLLPAQGSAHEELQLFSLGLNQVRLNYVDSVSYARMVRAALHGALRELDPHSYLATRPTWERIQALERRELANPGLHLEDVEDAITVLAVDDDSPAEQVGIMPGDRVIAVDGQLVLGRAARDVALLLTGTEDSRVQVTVVRGRGADADTVQFRPKRRMPQQRSVRTALMVEPGVGYVRLEQFGPNAATELREALSDLAGRGMQRAILDMRGNPGGLVTEAADLIGQFVDRGTLAFRTVGRKRDANAEYRTSGSPAFRRLPLLVLIDAGSASASEAVAGALQDHDRATIAGRRSFGKALVQSAFYLGTGDVLWLTIARVVSPSGRVIQRPYRDLTEEAYHAQAGTTDRDSAQSYRTAGGRPVRGGGGIHPDHVLPGPITPPQWWADAREAGLALAVADSVARALATDSGTRERWAAQPQLWERELLPALRARALQRWPDISELTPAQSEEIARRLAMRVIEVRWGAAAGELFRVRTDPDVIAALRLF